MDSSTVHRIKVDRDPYMQEQLNEDFKYEESRLNFGDIVSGCTSCEPYKTLKKTVPILEWLPKYKWKRNITEDLIAGFTVSVIVIPQGMICSLLGKVPPPVGIYMSLFPVLAYSILGTSRHISMGAFAITSLMVGTIVLEYSDPKFIANDLPGNTVPSEVEGFTPVEVATAVTFIVAIIQISMYVFRLGIISSLLSEALTSGFIAASAIQVLTSQVADLFGLHLPPHKGNFVVIMTWISVFQQLGESNTAAIVISAICIIIVVINNELLKAQLAKLCTIPIPMELVAVVVGTAASYVWNFKETYNIGIVGNIPSGLPAPSVPPLSLIGSVALSGFSIAIVSYAMAQSLALMFAQKLSYEVDANQELLAHGASNLLGSFFSCMPCSVSLSRSLIQESVGGKTQITSLVSCGVLVLVLIWIGPLVESLPRCILASVTVVALKGMLMQILSVVSFFRLSILDGLVWMITFIVVVFVSIDIGLYVGLAASLASIVLLSFKPYTCLLGATATPDIFLDVSRYKTATEVPGFKIYHYRGGINFASKGIFKTNLFELIELQPQKELSIRRKLEKYQKKVSTNDEAQKTYKEKLQKIKINENIKNVILDFSAVTYIDPSGASTVGMIGNDFKKLDIHTSVTGCCGPVYKMLSKSGVVNAKESFIKVYPTIQDAIQAGQVF